MEGLGQATSLIGTLRKRSDADGLDAILGDAEAQCTDGHPHTGCASSAELNAEQLEFSLRRHDLVDPLGCEGEQETGDVGRVLVDQAVGSLPSGRAGALGLYWRSRLDELAYDWESTKRGLEDARLP